MDNTSVAVDVLSAATAAAAGATETQTTETVAAKTDPSDSTEEDAVMEDQVEFPEIVETLAKLHCCGVCILRYTTNMDHDWPRYVNADKTVAEKYGVTISSPENNTCPTCAGIFQQGLDKNEKLQFLAQEVTRQNFDVDGFKLSISLPHAMVVRDYTMFLHLKATFPVLMEDLVYTSHDVRIMSSVKDVLRWMWGALLPDILNAPYDANATLNIEVRFTMGSEDASVFSALEQMSPKVFRGRKYQKGRKLEEISPLTIMKALVDDKKNNLRKYFPVPPKQPSVKCTNLNVSCTRDSIYVAGRYNKYSRDVAQTPWFIDGVRKGLGSVQECVSDKLVAMLQSDEVRMSGAGREDIDVRMLGSGRPFVLQFVNPKKVLKADLQNIQAEMNKATDLVRVTDLQAITKRDTSKLKDGEDSKTKTYSCVVYLSKDVSEEYLEAKVSNKKDLVVQQKTPIRVLHRRVQMFRPRTIHSMTAVKLKPHFIKLFLTTQAGTYIKEFVHGDFGRTSPNIGELLSCDADILSLDVEGINVDWPPRIA